MTTQRDQPIPPFDVESDEADVTQQFWGSSRGWTSHGRPGVRAHDDPIQDTRGDDSTGALRAIRDGVRAFRPQRVTRSSPTGQVARTRRHRALRSPETLAPLHSPVNEASLGDLASDWSDEVDAGDVDAFDGREPSIRNRPTGEVTDRHAPPEAGELVPLSPLSERIGLGAVDPLLLRMGMLILVGLLLVPLALALRSGSSSVMEGEPTVAGLSLAVANDFDSNGDEATGSDQPTSAATPEASGQGSPADTVTAAGTGVEPTAGATDDAVSAAVPAGTSSGVGDVIQSEQNTIGGAAGVSAVAEREVPACPSTYVAGAGDSWYRIAAAADITPNALFAENGATVDTVIFPGDPICLPAGATMPSPPTTPATTSAAATISVPPSTVTPTTAPATTQPAVPPANRAAVQQIIRDVWPDELEERALEIAKRESNYIATAHNGWCCYGVFQLYWTVHKSWLDDYGIYSSTDLFDARKNIQAAYGLYQSSGGWGPWGG